MTDARYKLTPADITAILHMGTTSNSELGRMFGVSSEWIRQIRAQHGVQRIRTCADCGEELGGVGRHHRCRSCQQQARTKHCRDCGKDLGPASPGRPRLRCAECSKRERAEKSRGYALAHYYRNREKRLSYARARYHGHKTPTSI